MRNAIPAVSPVTADRLLNRYCIGQRQGWSVLKASGPNIREYLQGQITQDITKLTPGQGIYACVLTPQGKVVSDLYLLTGHNQELILLVPCHHAASAVARFRQFALGHDVRIGIVEHLGLYSIQGAHAPQALVDFDLPEPGANWLATAAREEADYFVMTMPADPRGFWLVTAREAFDARLRDSDAMTDDVEFEAMRIIRGLPRFGVEWDESLHPLNANLIEMDGVSFDKGCYVGQEITSRMHWRGTIRKKLYRVQLDARPEKLPCPIVTEAQVGELRSVALDPDGQCFGIALLAVESVKSGTAMRIGDDGRLAVLGACHA